MPTPPRVPAPKRMLTDDAAAAQPADSQLRGCKHCFSMHNTAPVVPSAHPLPAGWLSAIDEESGATFYYNPEQNLTQWELPGVPEYVQDPGALETRPRELSSRGYECAPVVEEGNPTRMELDTSALTALTACPLGGTLRSVARCGSSATTNPSHSSLGASVRATPSPSCATERRSSVRFDESGGGDSSSNVEPSQTSRLSRRLTLAERGATTGGIADKIDTLLSSVTRNGKVLLDPAFLRPWRTVPPPPTQMMLPEEQQQPEAPNRASPLPPWYSPKRFVFTLFGSLIYGILFVPFCLAVLQQTMQEGSPVDPYGQADLSRSAWVSAMIFLSSLVLYTIIPLSFFKELYVGAETPGLGVFLGIMVGLIFLQQALAWRYILLRPELALVEKHRSKKFKLCGNVYSTMDPRNVNNYINLSLIGAEFFQFAAIIFHPSVPWLGEARDEDQWLAEYLTTVLPEALVANVGAIVLYLLLAYVAVYLLLLGEFVYSERDPHNLMGSIISDILAGTFYVSVVARLLMAADESAERGQRVMAVLALLAFMSTATFVTTLRGESGVSDAAELRFSCKWLAFERILKGTLGIAVVVCPRFGKPADGLSLIGWSIFLNLMHLVYLYRWRTCSVTWVRRMRAALLSLILWGQCVALFCVAVGGSSWFLLLIIGGSLCVAAMLGYCTYKVYYAPIPDGETPEVRAARLQRIQNDLLKRGVAKAVRVEKPASRSRGESIRPSVGRPSDVGRPSVGGTYEVGPRL